MPSYTPEQIKQAKEWLKDAVIWGWPLAKVALAALDAADNRYEEISEYAALQEERRDGWKVRAEAAKQERDALAAYAAKLEKAGDKIRRYKPDSNPLQAETDIGELFDDWDAARKEKP